MWMEQMNQATVTLEAISHNFCNQTVAGFDGSTICAVSSGLTGVSTGIIKFLVRVNGNFRGAVINATSKCVGTIKSDVQDLGGDLDQLKEDVAEVKALLGVVKELLNTPQGLRDNFPTK